MARRDPTIQDFAGWVQYHLDEAIKRAHRQCQVIERQNNAKGLLLSGNTIVECFDAGYVEFDKGIEATLGALSSAEERGVLDPESLYETVRNQLRQFARDMRHCCKAPAFREWKLVPERVLDEKEAEFDKKIDFALSQFEVGHLRPSQPDTPAVMKNEIKIDKMVGGAVQQGTTGSTQNVSITINVADVQTALTALEAALSKHPAPPEVAAEIEPELQTLKAQLSKTKPSATILREVGISLRNVAEGAGGALLASGVLEYLRQLVAVLPT